MTLVNLLLRPAQLAIASYASLRAGDTDQPENRDPLSNAGIPSVLRGDFASRFPAVVTQFNDTPAEGGMDMSFSATVFKDVSGNLTLAIRGTAETRDLAAATDIALAGAAYEQIVAMVNWWLRVSSEQGTAVPQYRFASYLPDVQPVGSVVLRDFGASVTVLESAPSVTATGALVAAIGADPDARIDLAGHSLGGHLSMAFSALFAEHVGQVTVFNAPGFKDTSANQAFFAKLGGSLPPAGSILNVAADEATVDSRPFNLIAGLHSRPGQAIDVAIEDQWSPTEPAPFGSRNHSSIALADSLALYELLCNLSPSLTFESYRLILNRAERITSASYESIVDAVEALFGVDDAPLSSGNANRDDLYTAIYGLSANPIYDARRETLEIAATPDGADALLDESQGGSERNLAYRYALVALNPFVAIDAQGTGLYSRYQTGGDRAGELDFFDRQTNPRGLTESFFRDRAELLERKLYITGLDRTQYYEDPELVPFGASPNPLDERGHAYQMEARHYEDRESKFVASTGGNLNALQLFVFGGRGADSIVAPASGREDHLYGGGGNDYLAGGYADDYVEGGAGFDVYQYSSSGSTNDGVDEIRDIDGKGVIRYSYLRGGLAGSTQSTPIAGVGVRVGANEWRSPDGKFTYRQQSSGLLVAVNGDAGGAVRILDFDYQQVSQSSHLGIRLVESVAIPTNVKNWFVGDKEDFDADPDHTGVQTRLDDFGNVVRDADRDQLDRPDVFFGSAVAGVDRFWTGGGNDEVFADGPGSATANEGASDWIELGAGRDFVYAGFGDDLIEGGADGDWVHTDSSGLTVTEAGGDVLQGGPGNDALFAGMEADLAAAILAGENEAATGQKGDFLSAGSGSDWLVAGAGEDLLFGGGGEDIIVAGAGDDTIASDQGYETQSLFWQVRRRTIVVPDGRSSYFADYSDNLTLADSSEGAADAIYGGAGSDWIFAALGDDFADGGSGDDLLLGMEGADLLLGGSGDDVLWGDAGHETPASLWGDYLDGGEGNDVLYGDWGDDALIGGPGDDHLYGGSASGRFAGLGKDIYVHNVGDGKDRIFDDSIRSEASILVFGDGLDADSFKVKPGSMILDFGQGDSVQFMGFDPYDANAPAAFDSLNFADGSVLTFQDVLERGFDIVGTEQDDDGHDAAHPVVLGTAFKDNIRGLGGDDELQGWSGADVLDGGSGNDRLFGMEGDDNVAGGAGADALVGGKGSDVLAGDEGADALWGEAGDDLLDGGDGSDTLSGGSGEDSYLFGAGDVAFDFDGASKVVFGPGIAPSDVALRVQIVNTLPTYSIELNGATTDAERMFIQLSSQAQLAAFEFDEGTVLDHEALLRETLVTPRTAVGTATDDVLEGYAGSDVLRGGDGNDTLIGRRADDRLEGGDGGDLYLVKRGDGLDTILEAAATGEDVLRLADIASTGVTLSRRANGDLVLSVAGGGSVTIAGQFNGGSSGLERVEFSDDIALERSDLDGLTLAPISGTAGDDVLAGTSFNDTLLGHGGADTLDGGAGDDILQGGVGVDTYVLGGQPGYDTLVECAAEASAIRLSSGIEFDDLRGTRQANDLLLFVRGVSGGLVIPGYFTDATNVTVSSDTEPSISVANLLAYIEGVTPADTPVEVGAGYLDDADLQYAIYLQSFGANGGVKVNPQAPSDAAVILRQSPFAETGSFPTFHLNIADISGGPSANLMDFRQGRIVIADGGAGDDLIDNQGAGFSNSGTLTSIGSLLYGNEGSDHILGTWAADTLLGGAGNDFLAGSDGDDTYVVFAQDAGIDVIDEVVVNVDLGAGHRAFAGGRNSTDTLKLVDVHFSDASFSVGQYDSNAVNVNGNGPVYATLDITWSDGRGARVVLPDENNSTLHQFPGHSYGIESIVFADGPTVSLNQILSYINAQTVGAPGDQNTVSGSDNGEQLAAPTNVRTTLNGLGGHDTLFGTGQNDALNGGDGDDLLDGGEGDDVLHGGPGNDALLGFRGNDLYLFNRGDGRDGITDLVGLLNLEENRDTLRFGADISPADIGVTRGFSSLYLVVLGSSDWITLGTAFPTDERWGLDRVEFADGTAWSREDVYARAGVIPGSSFDDVIGGTLGEDVIGGEEGDDVIFGFAGNDILRGGDGADDLEKWDVDPNFSSGGTNLIDAGAGDDYVYHEGHSFVAGGLGDDWIDLYGNGSVIAFNAGDGADTLYVAGTMTLSLGGIMAADLVLSEIGNGLVLTAGADSIRLFRPSEPDPHTWPQMRLQIVDSDIRTYDFVAVSAAFYAARGSNGAFQMTLGDVLPQHELSVSGNEAVGGDVAYAYAHGELEALADADIQQVLADANFGVEPQFVDRAPAAPIDGHDNGGVLLGTSAPEEITGGLGNDWLNGGAGDDRLNGGEGDDLLSGGLGADIYVYDLGDGIDMIADPSAADQGNIVEFGPGITPDMLTLGVGSMLVRVGDTAGALHLASFDPLAPFGARDIDLYRFVDGTVLTHEAMLEKGFDLNGTAGADVISGTATADRIRGGTGDDALAGGLGSDVYSYDNGDGADVLLEGIDEAAVDVLRFGSGILPGSLGVARAMDDIVIALPATGDQVRLAGWFTAAQGTIERIEFAEGGAWTAAQLEARTAVNQAPSLAVPIPDQLAIQDVEFVYAVSPGTFVDPDSGDAVRYGAKLAGGSPLPAWLSFDEIAGRFSGTPANADVGHYSLQVMAMDAGGLFTTAVFGIAVDNINDVPVARDDATQLAEDGVPFAAGNVLANDTDIDAGTVLSVTNPGIYGGTYGTLVLGADGAYAYTLDADAAQRLAAEQLHTELFGYAIADDDVDPLTATGRLRVVVAGANDTPVVGRVPADQSGREGEAFTVGLAGIFTDVDAADAVTLAAMLADGAALPPWLAFDEGRLAGTPEATAGGEYSIRVVATDIRGESASASFRLTVLDSLAEGNRLIGTSYADVLNGTALDEFLDGRGGADRLLAGGGDDVLQLYADERVRGKNRALDFFDGGPGFDILLGSEGGDALFLDDGGGTPRLAGIEHIATGGGHDRIDLRSDIFDYGDVILDGGEGHDVLNAASGDDVLLGGGGHDELSGGAGRDTYIHGLRDGHDVIDEHGDIVDVDVLRFGDGIAPGMVRASRRHHDLVLDVPRQGSVTVKGWFASAAQRVELIAFADGTVWDENILSGRVTQSGIADAPLPFQEHRPDLRPPADESQRRSNGPNERDNVAAVTPAPVPKPPVSDFASISETLEQAGWAKEPISRVEIRRLWDAVRRHAQMLEPEFSDFMTSASPLGKPGAWTPAGFGFEASIGAARGPDGLKSLAGLTEGFERL